jgi:hypothetical protein
MNFCSELTDGHTMSITMIKSYKKIICKSQKICGTLMEKTQNKKPIKSRDTVVKKDLPSCSQQGASQSGEPPQGAGIPSKPRDIEHLTKVKDKRAQDVTEM